MFGDDLRLRLGRHTLAEGTVRDETMSMQRSAVIEMRVRGPRLGAAPQRVRRQLAQAYLAENPRREQVLVPMRRGFEVHHRDRRIERVGMRVRNGIATLRGDAGGFDVLRAAVSQPGVDSVRRGGVTLGSDAVRSFAPPSSDTASAGRLIVRQRSVPGLDSGRARLDAMIPIRVDGRTQRIRVLLRTRVLHQSSDANGGRHETLAAHVVVRHSGADVRRQARRLAQAELLSTLFSTYLRDHGVESATIVRGRGGRSNDSRGSNADQTVIIGTREGSGIRLDVGQRRRVLPENPNETPLDFFLFEASPPERVLGQLRNHFAMAPERAEVVTVDAQGRRPSLTADAQESTLAARARLLARNPSTLASERARRVEPSSETGEAVRGGSADWLRRVNRYGGRSNCTNCAVAVALTLRGEAHHALYEAPRNATTPTHNFLERSVGLPVESQSTLGRRLSDTLGGEVLRAVGRALRMASVVGLSYDAVRFVVLRSTRSLRGRLMFRRLQRRVASQQAWQMGLVYGVRRGGSGHAFNYVNTPRGPVLLDGQVGQPVTRGLFVRQRYESLVVVETSAVDPSMRRAVTALMEESASTSERAR